MRFGFCFGIFSLGIKESNLNSISKLVLSSYSLDVIDNCFCCYIMERMDSEPSEELSTSFLAYDAKYGGGP